MDNNNEINNKNSQPDSKKIEKQKTAEAYGNAADTAAQAALLYGTKGKAMPIYQAAMNTQVGQALKKNLGNRLAKLDKNLGTKKVVIKANESGLFDKVNQVMGMTAGGKSKEFNSSKESNDFRQKVTPFKQGVYSNANELENAENLEEIDQIKKAEKINQKSKKNKENFKKNIDFIRKHPETIPIILAIIVIATFIFILMYMIASDMDFVGTRMNSYDEAKMLSGYCQQIRLIKEHDQYLGDAVSDIDSINLEETFRLNGKYVKRWEYVDYSLEEYTEHVVQAEASEVNDEKTYEVASILARTYALQIASSQCYTWDNTNKREEYRNPQNFTNDNISQVVRSSVIATSGLVLTLDDKLVDMSNNSYYDYFCIYETTNKSNNKENGFYKMLQKNKEERLFIPVKWAKDIDIDSLNRSGKYKGGIYNNDCQKKGLSLFGAKYLLNKKVDAYSTIRVLKYYYGYHTELKKVSNSSIFNGGCYHWPLSIQGTITSEFGYRVSPTAGASSNHKGIDIGISEGTQVLATAAGTVTKAGAASGYGYAVFIDHGNGLTSKYGHLKADGIQVKVGDNVTQGQVIALSGNTGVSTGPHLHFQIELNGIAVNPLNYVNQDNPTPSCESLTIPGENYTGTSKTEFIAYIAPFAVNDMHTSNILASVTIAQAALESGWGTSSLARNYNNYFGVKAIGGWNGSSVNMGTTECEGTRCYATSANWRIYASPQESISDHSGVLSAKRYNGVIGEKNYKNAIQIIKNGGYATDPDYVSKIVSIIEKNELYKYDSM